MILRVLHATSEELGASAITYHQESFHAIPIYSHHFVHAALRVIFNLMTVTLLSRLHLPLVTLGIDTLLFYYILLMIVSVIACHGDIMR